MLIECTENGAKGTEDGCELYGAVVRSSVNSYIGRALILQVFT